MFITLLLKIFNGNTKFKNTYDAKCEGERHREGEGANLESKHLPKSRYKVQCKLKYLAAEVLDFKSKLNRESSNHPKGS